MIYFNHTQWLRGGRFCLLLSSLIAISGCSVLSEKDADVQQQADVANNVLDEAPIEESVPDIFTPIANPYLAQKQPVPSELKANFSKVKLAMGKKAWNSAEKQLQELIERYPTYSGLYTNLGIVYEKQKKLEKAESNYRYAIQTNGFNPHGYNQLATLYREQGKFTDAESVYLSALEVWPHNLQAVKNIAILYDLYMGKWAEAETYYTLALDIEPNNRLTKGWLMDLKRRMAQ